MPATPSSEKHRCGAMSQGHVQDHLLFVFLLVLASLSNSEILITKKVWLYTLWNRLGAYIICIIHKRSERRKELKEETYPIKVLDIISPSDVFLKI